MKKLLFAPFALLLLVAGITFPACNKDSGDHEQPNTATIDIQSPAEGATFAVGATVPVDVLVEGRESLHGWEITLRNKADNSQLAHFSGHDHGSTYDVLENWVANVAAGTNVELEVVVVVDHDGAETSKKLTFKVQ